MARPSISQITAALSYAVTSIFILMTNKIILTSYHFHFTALMTLFHMCVSWALLTTLKAANIIHFTPFDRRLAIKTFPVSILFVFNVWLGMCALRLTNIPMFTTLRRLTVLITLLAEWYYLRTRPSVLVFCSVMIMVLGSFIGSNGDLQFDLWGYSLVLLNNCVTAAYLVVVKGFFQDSALKQDPYGVMYYNSILSMPLLLVLSLWNGEFPVVFEFPYWGTGTFEFYFLLSALCAFLMNYSTYWCTEVNSPLTLSVTGQVKNVLSSFVSLLGFGVTATPHLMAGLLVGLSGSIMYSYAKSQAGGVKPKSDIQGQGQGQGQAQGLGSSITMSPALTNMERGHARERINARPSQQQHQHHHHRLSDQDGQEQSEHEQYDRGDPMMARDRTQLTHLHHHHGSSSSSGSGSTSDMESPASFIPDVSNNNPPVHTHTVHINQASSVSAPHSHSHSHHLYAHSGSHTRSPHIAQQTSHTHHHDHTNHTQPIHVSPKIPRNTRHGERERERERGYEDSGSVVRL